MKKIFPEYPNLLLYASQSWNLGLAAERLQARCRTISTFSDTALASKFITSYGSEIDCVILIVPAKEIMKTPFGILAITSKPMAKLVAAITKKSIFSAIINPITFWEVFDHTHLSATKIAFNQMDRAVGPWPSKERLYMDLDWSAVFSIVQGFMHERGDHTP